MTRQLLPHLLRLLGLLLKQHPLLHLLLHLLGWNLAMHLLLHLLWQTGLWDWSCRCCPTYRSRTRCRSSGSLPRGTCSAGVGAVRHRRTVNSSGAQLIEEIQRLLLLVQFLVGDGVDVSGIALRIAPIDLPMNLSF